ncbi:MAG: DUF7694 domain-containing protein [Nitrospiria bacterium]
MVLRSLVSFRGEPWIHLSISYPNKLPTWDEIVSVRDIFLGNGVEAYQVIPKLVDYVNTHRYCLHLWAPVDGRRRVANVQELEEERPI